MDAKRLDYFDTARGIGICLVVLGHITYIGDSLRIWIFSFHMPLFFIISGMLIHYKEEERQDLKKTAVKRARGLMIPYFWFSVLSLLVDLCVLLTGGRMTVENLLASVYATASLYGMSTLWFLPALFLGELLFLLILKKLPRSLAFVVMIALTFLCGMGITNTYRLALLPVDQVFLYYAQFPLFVLYKSIIGMSYIALGYLAFHLFLLPGSSVGGGFRIRECACGLLLTLMNVLIGPRNGNADLGHLLLNNMFLYYLCGFAGSFGLILICKNIRPFRVLSFFGKNSVIIMATHLNLYVSYAAIKVIFLISPRMEAFRTALAVLLFLVTMAMEYILILVINRFFPFIVGRRIRGGEKFMHRT